MGSDARSFLRGGLMGRVSEEWTPSHHRTPFSPVNSWCLLESWTLVSTTSSMWQWALLLLFQVIGADGEVTADVQVGNDF